MMGPRVFIAGTMQGASNGFCITDQSYRTAISTLVAQRWPGAQCIDPSQPVRKLADAAASDHAVHKEIYGQLDGSRVKLDDLSAEIQRFRTAFRDMTTGASKCDLVIAYLPGTTPSMGTAMEMYQAFIASVPVVAVTGMHNNLSIVATATWILSDLAELKVWLDDHQWDHNQGRLYA